MKRSHGVIGLMCIIALGCQPKSNSVITYQLERKDYSERIFGTGTLQSANNTVISTPNLASNTIEIVHLEEEGITTHAGDTVCILKASDLEKIYDQFIEDKEKLNADLVRLEASNAESLSQLKAQLEEFKAQNRLSTLDSIQQKFAPHEKSQTKILEEKINKIQQSKVIKKMEALQKINEQSARALKSQIIQKNQRIGLYKDQLDQLIVTAPAEGLLVYASSPMFIMMDAMGGYSSSGGGKLKIGSTIYNGMPLIELPNIDSMEIVIMVQEADFKRVQTGQKVIIKPESLPDFVTTGTVKSKSLSSKPLAYRFKVKSYKVVIDIDSDDNIFLPGLSANCELIVQEVKDTVVAPTICIFEADSSKYIYVKRGELFEKQVITTGQGNPSETIISTGLEGNEIIALLEPPINQIGKQKKDHE